MYHSIKWTDQIMIELMLCGNFVGTFDGADQPGVVGVDLHDHTHHGPELVGGQVRHENL